MTDPTPHEPHPLVPDPSLSPLHFIGGKTPEALCYFKGALGPSGRPLPPRRTTQFAPWECVACGRIFESLDEPGIACGVTNGALDVTCRQCLEDIEQDMGHGHE